MNHQTRRWLRYGLIGLIVVLLVLYLGLPAALGAAAVQQRNTEVGDTPGGYRDEPLTTDDGVELKTWYRPPVSGKTLILVHGSGGSREDLRPYMDVLTRHGYGVLAMDLRGHGQSGGKTHRLGWNNSLDIKAAVEFLDRQFEVDAIGALGLSMGGEILLGAAADHPEIRVIVADGATHRSLEELTALDSEKPLVRNFTARVMYAVAEMLGGVEPPQPLLDSISAADQTRFFFIAAGDETAEVNFNRLYVERLGADRAQLWIAPDADHLEALGKYPQEYEDRLIQFLEENL